MCEWKLCMAKLNVPLKCSEVLLTWISASQINKQLETEYEVSVSRQAINQFILYYQTKKISGSLGLGDFPFLIHHTHIHYSSFIFELFGSVQLPASKCSE